MGGGERNVEEGVVYKGGEGLYVEGEREMGEGNREWKLRAWRRWRRG